MPLYPCKYKSFKPRHLQILSVSGCKYSLFWHLFGIYPRCAQKCARHTVFILILPFST